MSQPETRKRSFTLVNSQPETAKRIVSLVPSLTELLADLGVGERVVGVTRFCVHPAGWKAEKTIVGGTKDVNGERVRALAPDLVIANKEENTQADVEALQAFTDVRVTDIANVADTLEVVRTLGGWVGATERADAIAEEVARCFAELPAFPPRRALYLIWRNPWMTVGCDTIIHDVMARGGFVNVCADRTRYPALTGAAIRALAPDTVLLSSEPYPFEEKHIAELHALVPNADVRLVDGELFSWYGSRLRRTPAYLRRLRAEIPTPAAP